MRTVGPIDIPRQARRFGRAIKSIPGGYKIEGEPPMTEAETLIWIQNQTLVQCSKCGAYRTPRRTA